MKKQPTKKTESSHGAAIGLGLAAAAAAAAGAYFLYGSTKGPARRKAIKSWMIKMKGEVMEEIENMQDVTEEAYHKVVDKVKEKYALAKNVDMKELEAVTKTLKNHWKDIKKEVKKEISKN